MVQAMDWALWTSVRQVMEYAMDQSVDKGILFDYEPVYGAGYEVGFGPV